MIAVLDEIIAAHPLDYWAERFDREGAWWAPAQGPADVLEDPQLAATDGLLAPGDGSEPGAGRQINGPVSFSDVPVVAAAAAPRLGEHTDEVLTELS